MIGLLLPIAIKNKSESFKEDELVRSLQSGNIKAFSHLYNNYAPALLGIISRIVNCKESSEDALQETFIKISRYISFYDPNKSRLFTWMAKLAKNTAIDQVRSRGYKDSNKCDDLDEIVETIEYYHNASYNPDTIGIKQLIHVLTPIQKQILDLVYFQGYTHTEAAEELGMPVGTIKTRIRNAILTLRQYFNN